MYNSLDYNERKSLKFETSEKQLKHDAEMKQILKEINETLT
jgi:hypothetical protein